MKTVSYELAKEMLDTLRYAASCLGTDGNDLVDLMISKAKAAMAEPQPDSDGWIKWVGGEWGRGECPVPDGTLIDVEYRDGERQVSLPANKLADGKDRDASICFWYDEGEPNDIIAYRIVEGD